MRFSRLTFLLLPLALAILAPAPASAQGRSVHYASDEDKQEATALYQKGVKAFKRRRYKTALSNLRESYDLVASPNAHLMMAQAMAKLGQNREAYEELGSVISEAWAVDDKKYAGTMEAARKLRGKLMLQIAFVRIQVQDPPKDAKLEVAKEEIPQADWGKPIAVNAGTVKLRLSGGKRSQSRRVKVKPGETHDVALSLDDPSADDEAGAVAAVAGDASEDEAEGDDEPQEDDEQPAPGGAEPSESSETSDLRMISYVAIGVGVAGAVTFAVFGALNNAKFDNLESSCEGNLCDANLEGEADTGRTYQSIANAGLVIGVLGVAAGTTLYLLSDDEEGSGSASLGIGPGHVRVSGSF